MELDNFPKEKLRNVISLASPNINAPQELTYDMIQTLNQLRKQELPEHVAYFHFDGGVRDFFVGQALAKTTNLSPTSIVLHTETMKNVRLTLDHNAFLYSRIWLNQLIPFMATVTSMSLTDPQDGNVRSTAQERIDLAR